MHAILWLFRFSHIDQPEVKVHILAQQQNAQQQRFARQMANRNLVVPSVKPKQQQQQVNIAEQLFWF